jgi:CheY-like chemotaxis protein/HPt (histidine-containing phosphotransfer) domain-containing protein
MSQKLPDVTAIAGAMQGLRDRFRQSNANSLATLRQLGEQLRKSPDAQTVVEALRRELHRIHGTAGTFGFREASALAGVMERRAIQWAAHPSADRTGRGDLVIDFVDRLSLAMEDEGHGPLPDLAPRPRKRMTPTVNVAYRARPTPPWSHPAVDGSVAVSPPPERGRFESQPVAVVEDDQTLSSMIVYALSLANLKTISYPDGPAALQGLLDRADRQNPMLILMDIDLPGLDGHSLHERVTLERPGAFRVVFMSAHAHEADQLRALKSGAIDYLVKPVSLRVLLAKMPTWLALLKV